MPKVHIANFSQLETGYFLLRERQAYSQALKLIRQEYSRFPQAKALLTRWCIGLFAQMGQADKALAALEDALSAGHYFREEKLRHDVDLQSLRHNPRFRSLSKQSGTLYEEHRRQVQPTLQVLRPSTPPPWPVLLALHEGMGSAALAELTWHTAVSDGWLVALPQSSQLGWATGHYVWDDLDLSLSQLQSQYAQLQQEYPLQRDRIVVAGYGQGGYTAQKALEQQALPAHGAILVEGWSLDSFKHMHHFLSRSPRPCYYLLAGQNIPDQIFDHYEEAQKLSRQFARMGFRCRVEGWTGKKAGLPEEFGELLGRGLQFVSMCNAQ